MQVHIYRGAGRTFAFTNDAAGTNLPSRYGPWSPFKTLEMNHGDEPRAAVNNDECLDDIEKYGIHLTDAHVRIPQT